MRGAYLGGSIVVSGSGQALAGNLAVRQDPLPASVLAGSLTVSGALSAAMQPADASTVSCGMEVWVGGVKVSRRDVIQEITVERSLDQRAQTWSFSVALRTPQGPLGSPFVKVGPSTCKQAVDVFGVVRVDGVTHRIPLIVGGIGKQTTRSSGSGGHVEVISGVDRTGRFDRVPATLSLPAGHGTPRGMMVRALQASAGDTLERLTPGPPCYKPLSATDADWMALGEEIVDTDGQVLMRDRSGALVNPVAGRPDDDEPIAFRFKSADFLKEVEITSSHPGDVITECTLTGQEQLVSEPGVCEVVLEPQEDEVRAPYAPRTVPFAQGTGGYSATGLIDGEASERVTSLTIFERETRCGVVVWERKRVWGYLNPQVARYRWDNTVGDGAWARLGGCFVPNSIDDQEPALGFNVEQFIKLSDEETWHFYNRAGFRLQAAWPGPGNVPMACMDGLLGPTSSETREGDYLGSASRSSAVYVPRAALKDRTSGAVGDPWDAISPIPNVRVLGDYTAIDLAANLPWIPQGVVHVDGEMLHPVSISVTTHHGDAAGILRKAVETTFGWRVTSSPGGRYFYSDETVSNDPTESWGFTGSKTTRYISTGASSHTEEWETVSQDGSVSRSGSGRSSGQPGYGPAIAMMDITGTSPLAGEEGSVPMEARKENTRIIKASIQSTTLLQCHLPLPHKAAAPWAETESELVEMCKRVIENSCAADVSGRLAGANFAIEPGMRIAWEHPPIDLNCERVRVRRVRWTASPRRVTVDLEGKAYAW